MTRKRDDIIVISKKEYNSAINKTFSLGLDEGKDQMAGLLLKTGRIRFRDLAGIEGAEDELNLDSCRDATKNALKAILK